MWLKGKSTMCTSQSADLVREVVTDKVNSNVMFTAWEVTLEVQKRAKAQGIPTERHRDLKNTIHAEVEQYVQNGVYEKTLHDVGAPIPAFVYHPTGTDVNTYVPLTRNDPAAVTPAPAPVRTMGVGKVVTPVPSISSVASPTTPTTTTTTSNPNRGNTTNRIPDGRGTVSVPNALVRKVGFHTGDVAYVVSESNASGVPTLVIGKQPKAGCPMKGNYTVDHGDNIRITYGQLVACGLTDKPAQQDTYDFTTAGNNIVVTKH
jgi:hypothetical protein